MTLCCAYVSSAWRVFSENKTSKICVDLALLVATMTSAETAFNFSFFVTTECVHFSITVPYSKYLFKG